MCNLVAPSTSVAGDGVVAFFPPQQHGVHADCRAQRLIILSRVVSWALNCYNRVVSHVLEVVQLNFDRIL